MAETIITPKLVASWHHTDIHIPADTEVLAIGPGLGQHPDTQATLHTFLLQQRSSEKPMLPMVLDADALNILSLHPEWLTLLPAGTILTPHPGEMKRLGMDPYELAERYQLIIVLKGHQTKIIAPSATADGTTYINTLHGNPGVWYHALAADLALADHNSVESLLPSDIIAHLGEAFLCRS